MNKSALNSDVLTSLQSWVGRTEVIEDSITAAPAAGLSATLDRDDAPSVTGTRLPELWHWLYFLPHHRQSELSDDGHAKRGGFLPPVPLPSRMWAGSRLEWLQPLRVGDAVRRTSSIKSVTHKSGRSGELVFVKVGHEVHNQLGLSIIEEHDIVYRDAPQTGAAAPASVPAPSDPSWVREIAPDDVLLFRYSALTFNGHRIHYDRRYVTQVEGYPGLVVHGPLIATLLLDLLRRQMPEAQVRRFEFRAIAPTFDTAPFQVCGKLLEDGKTVELWAQSLSGVLAMQATATLV
jgi:3-methylfumaryl-CoA hydratase